MQCNFLSIILCSLLTVKGEVAEQRRQHVHDEHGEDGQVGHVLHLFPRATKGVVDGEKKTTSML